MANIGLENSGAPRGLGDLKRRAIFFREMGNFGNYYRGGGWGASS